MMKSIQIMRELRFVGLLKDRGESLLFAQFTMMRLTPCIVN